jgi:hypothetical protein
MGNKLAWFGLFTFLLVGCDTNDPFDSTTVIEPQVESPATPTLIPGLPTSTPTSSAAALPFQTPSRDLETPTIPKPATATPIPEQRLILGQNYLESENFAQAEENLAAGIQSGELTDQQSQEALLELGQAQLGMGDDAGAAESLSAFLSSSATNEPDTNGTPVSNSLEIARSEAYFFLGQALANQPRHGRLYPAQNSRVLLGTW